MQPKFTVFRAPRFLPFKIARNFIHTTAPWTEQPIQYYVPNWYDLRGKFSYITLYSRNLMKNA
jgi:hypothetical protein